MKWEFQQQHSGRSIWSNQSFKSSTGDFEITLNSDEHYSSFHNWSSFWNLKYICTCFGKVIVVSKTPMVKSMDLLKDYHVAIRPQQTTECICHHEIFNKPFVFNVLRVNQRWTISAINQYSRINRMFSVQLILFQKGFVTLWKLNTTLRSLLTIYCKIKMRFSQVFTFMVIHRHCWAEWHEVLPRIHD